MKQIILAPHRILIEERVVEEKTNGGIILPSKNLEEYQAAQCEGIIVAEGDDCFLDWGDDNKPNIGDVVYFNKYDGKGKTYGGKFYRILVDEMVDCKSAEYLDKWDELGY